MTGHDRPAIIAAKQRRHARVVADADRLKAMEQTDRPVVRTEDDGTEVHASVDDVRTAYADAMDALAEDYTSVAGVEGIDLPSDRLTPSE